MLKLGKLTNDELSQIVLSNIPHIREEVLLQPGIGEDCAALDLKNRLCIVSSDPITAANADAGAIAVYVACNDIAAAGGKPLAMMVTLLIPPHMELCDIKEVIKSMSEAAQSIQVEIMGGHTEITDAVNRIVISSTVIGVPVTGKMIPTSGAQAGDCLVITKYAALEGTAILANDFSDKLKQTLSQDELKQAQALLDSLSVLSEGEEGAKQKATAMHDVTEGGVYGAAHEMAQAARLGIELYENRIPLLDLTKKITEAFHINPYRLISSGSMLISVKEPEALIEALKKKNIKATVIGRFLKDETQKYIVLSNGQKSVLDPPGKDELFKARE